MPSFGTQELSDVMLKALEGRSACLLGNHGQIAFGPNLEKALWRAGEVETISHQYWAALQAGKPVLLNERQMTTVLARFKTYGKQPDELGKDDAPAVQAPVRRDTAAGRRAEEGQEEGQEAQVIAGVSPLVAELKARADAGRPVTIGLAGCGQMGTDLVVQLRRMPGLSWCRRRDAAATAKAAAALAGLDDGDTVYADSPAAIDRAIEMGKVAITASPDGLARAGLIDVVIDATGNPDIGTRFALDAIANGKHVVMLNVEADVTIGRYLHEQAKKAGVVYTVRRATSRRQPWN